MSSASAARTALLRQRLELTEQLVRERERKRLFSYQPYPKQYEFHAAGLRVQQRLLMKGNRVGGTLCAGFEIAMHLTGLYPDWWPGRRWDRAVDAWAISPSAESCREIIQKTLLGSTDINMTAENMGTGTIPKDRIVRLTPRQAGIKGVMDEVYVRHVSGELSRLATKSHEQGREKVQSASLDIVWPDEEPPVDIHGELIARVQDRNGMMIETFTPLKGITPIVRAYIQPQPGESPKHVTFMTLHDCVGGTWPADFPHEPWRNQPWKGHFTEQRVKEIIASYMPHERKTRVDGVPMMGEGMVFPIDDDEISVSPFKVPSHWARICGIDFGIDHPTAGVWLAHDRDTDTIYVYDEYRRTDALISTHASAFRRKDPEKHIPVAWPHDGLKRDGKSGEQTAKAYKREGVNLMLESARYEDDKGGAQAVEPAVQEIWDRMNSGRWKVFSTCQTWLEEKRMYHRKNGVIVDSGDDLMAATRVAVMQLRSARTQRSGRPSVVVPYNRPIVGAPL